MRFVTETLILFLSSPVVAVSNHAPFVQFRFSKFEFEQIKRLFSGLHSKHKMASKYENSPCPSDYDYEEVLNMPPTFFTLSRPQNIFVEGFLSVDYSLIHPRLLGIESEDEIIDERGSETIEKTNESVQEDLHKDVEQDVNEKIKQPNVTGNEKTDFMTVRDQNTPNNEMHERKASAEIESSSTVQGKSIDAFQREVISSGTKRRKCHRRHQTIRVISLVDSDESDFNSTSVEEPGYELIEKSYSKKFKTTLKDPDRYRPKLRKHSKTCIYKKRISLYDDQSSNSDRSKTLDRYSRKSKRRRTFCSDEELSLPNRYDIPPRTFQNRHLLPSSSESRVKQEVFSNDDVISYLGRHERLENDTLSENGEERNSRWCSPKKEKKQEIKREPLDCKDKEFHGPDVFYCSYCKLTLNSELTWTSHLLGQRHAKAIRAQSVHEVARSSLLNPIITTTYAPVFEEGNRHDKPPPGMERVELKKRVASIQEVCDSLQHRQLIMGLKHVWEIRNETETAYYCNLCDAPCGPSSVMPHVTGFKHRLMCLKEYFPQVYDQHKDDPKRRIEKIIDNKFSGHGRLMRREKIRVFKDIPITDSRKSSTFSDDQPGPSWRTSYYSPPKDETLIVKDENGKPVVPSNQECLDTKYADFHCTVCDSHMNNIAMWESHIRGKRHLKNMKKDTQGVEATNKYIKAPPGTVSNLIKQIEKVCSSGEIIVGLKYIRENQGKNGNQYNCFPCGGCCSDIDIVDHILSMKHKTKYLEKMNVDGFTNAIEKINNIQIATYFREQMIDEECRIMVRKYGRGKPKVYYIKRDLTFGAI